VRWTRERAPSLADGGKLRLPTGTLTGGAPGWAGEEQPNPSELLVRLSTRICMKNRNRLKSAGDFPLWCVIPSLADPENNDYGLFLIGE
jgi:hypothetical protein